MGHVVHCSISRTLAGRLKASGLQRAKSGYGTFLHRAKAVPKLLLCMSRNHGRSSFLACMRANIPGAAIKSCYISMGILELSELILSGTFYSRT
jgi:hypothetical protein